MENEGFGLPTLYHFDMHADNLYLSGFRKLQFCQFITIFYSYNYLIVNRVWCQFDLIISFQTFDLKVGRVGSM